MPFNGLVRRGLLPLSSAITSNRIFWYSAISTCATAFTILNACKDYSNFYSIAVYLSRSGRSLLVLANFGFILALLSGSLLQRIFFGPLQPREVERLYDQTWMFVTESLLAFTIFRDDFDIPFVIMFGFLLFIKCFHWLLADRVESMDQVPYPGPPVLFHIRLHALFMILWLIDIGMLIFAIDSTMSTGVGGAVLFANEYAILTASALNSMARYVLSSLEIRRARTRGGINAPAWENKSMYIFYIELVTDFLKLSTYLTFFAVVLTFYGLPLNIIRDVYLTARSFITRLRALVRYHNATRDMDRRYPNATEEELTAMSDRTCIICREELIAATNNQNHPADNQAPDDAQNANPVQDGPNVTPKKLPCGHIFHFQCLRSWLERQQSCPTCRRTVLETDQANGNAAQAGARGARPPGHQQQNGAPQVPPPPGQQAPNLGWLGRLLGIALQPPLVPGQFANAQMVPPLVPAAQQGPQQVPANPGWPAPGQQPPPGYAYPLPYQMQQPIPPQQLQPPPAYRGFYGPGGVWYPWAPDAQFLPQGQQAPNQPAEAAGPSQPPVTQAPSTTGPSASGPIPTPTTGAMPSSAPAATDGPAQPSSTRADTSATTSENSGSRSATPRDAAALAALRRLGSSQSSSNTHPPDTHVAGASASLVPTSTDASIPTSASTDPSITDRPSGSQHASGPSAASTSASAAQPTPTTAPTVPTTGDRPQAPPLIPLWDPMHYAQQMRTQLYPWQQMPVGWPQYPSGQRIGPGQAPQAYRSLAQAATRANASSSRSQPRESLAQLPATLTDEQLTRLDRLTRDAIDERLRVLEGVSGTLWRCIQELHRMRSVLPPREVEAAGPVTEATPAEGAQSTPNAEFSSEATNSDKGKGVSTNTSETQPDGPSTSRLPQALDVTDEV